MYSPLKNYSNLHSLNYPSGSQSWLYIKIIQEVVKPYQSKIGENIRNMYHIVTHRELLNQEENKDQKPYRKMGKKYE